MADIAACLCGARDGCCRLCPILRPNRRPHHPDVAWGVCPDCRLRLEAIPREIADAYALLPELAEPSIGGRGSEVRNHDPDPPMPLGDPHDLMWERPLPVGPIAAARLAQYPQDQIGRLSVAGILWGHVRIWIEQRGLRETGPEPTVPKLCDWLAVRTDWAVDHHPDVEGYAQDMTDLRGLLTAMIGRNEPCTKCGGARCQDCHWRGYVPIQKPQPLPGVPCPRCRRMSLSREPDGDIACGWEGCNSRWRPDEYDQRQKAVAKAVQRGQIQIPEREDVTT